MKLDKIKESIAEIAGRRKNVTFSEIENLMRHLPDHGFVVTSRPAGDHGVLFRVNDRMFGICTHRGGSKQLDPCYVKEFLDAMIDVGLYE